MQAPPDFSFKITKSRLAGALIVVFSAFSLLWVVLWGLAAGDPGDRTLLLLLVLLVVQLSLLRRVWNCMLEGRLQWSGDVWHWSPAGENAKGGQSGRVAVCVDLVQIKLLRFQPESGPGFWLWVDRQMTPPLWYALQRALVWCPRVTGFDKVTSK